jgi:hypothetical protein
MDRRAIESVDLKARRVRLQSGEELQSIAIIMPPACAGDGSVFPANRNSPAGA